MKLGQGKKAWAGRTAQLVAALLVLLVLGACEQLASAPEVELSPAAVTLNRPIYLTSVYNAAASTTFTGYRRDKAGITSAEGTYVINNRYGSRRVILLFTGGDGKPYRTQPVAPGTTVNGTWWTRGPARTYNWQICAYVPSSGSYVWSCPATPNRISLD